MANISDIIEQFILSTLGDDEYLDISRNELASYFTCAPSQINYVLETRFTSDRGFIKESRRGGGGYIRVSKVPITEENYVNSLIVDSIGEELKFSRAQHILEKLVSEKILSKRESLLVSAAISDSSLTSSLAMKDRLRASIFRNVLLYVLKEKK